MSNPKTIFVTFGINKEKYRNNFELESEIQKYLRVFSYQILSAKDYLYEVLNTYRFFPVNLSYKGQTKNFPAYSQVEDGANQQNLSYLANSFNIVAPDSTSIIFEWESKLTEKITELGINNYLQLYFKYLILDRVSSQNEAESIAGTITTNVFEWHDYEVSEDSSNVYTTEKYDLTISLEIVLPKQHFNVLSSAVNKLKEMFTKLQKFLAVGIKIKFIEFIWR